MLIVHNEYVLNWVNVLFKAETPKENWRTEDRWYVELKCDSRRTCTNVSQRQFY